jgi:peptidoglycan/LPS O-acetylase OafA/YrhL
MVTIFFVISGFALSYKALRQMRNRQFAPVLETLVSSLFRRGTRLYLPITVSTLISMLFRVADLYPVDPWPPLTLPGVAPTFLAQLYDWFLNWLVLINPFQPIDVGNPYPPPYDSHLWS